MGGKSKSLPLKKNESWGFDKQSLRLAKVEEERENEARFF
jgi:hypothetical protein